MKKIKVLLALICFALMATMTPLASHAEDVVAPFEVPIEVAPSVINLGSASPWVTIHAEIPYLAVKTGSVRLYLAGDSTSGDVGPVLCFADERGDFVAKFDMEAVRAFIDITAKGRGNGVSINFELKGETASDPIENFYGSQDILVFNNNKGAS